MLFRQTLLHRTRFRLPSCNTAIIVTAEDNFVVVLVVLVVVTVIVVVDVRSVRTTSLRLSAAAITRLEVGPPDDLARWRVRARVRSNATTRPTQHGSRTALSLVDLQRRDVDVVAGVATDLVTAQRKDRVLAGDRTLPDEARHHRLLER